MFTRPNRALIALLCLLRAAPFMHAHSYEQEQVEVLSTCITLPDPIKMSFLALASDESRFEGAVYDAPSLIPLFAHYPAMQASLSYISLGALPTPITHCATWGAELGVPHLYMKRDDLTGGYDAHGRKLFGGNKVRKLEFVLADALAHDSQCVMTFGCVGSNHALATATYAHELGMSALLLLKPQANARVVRRNLLLDAHAHAELTFSSNNAVRSVVAAYKMYECKQRHGEYPYVIPTGASCPLGALGYVNAVFELKEQIDAGLMPEPDRIYVAIGSAGTAAGLALGIKAVGLRSHLICVAVEPSDFYPKLHALFKESNQLLHDADDRFALYDLKASDVTLITQAAGDNYAVFTPEAVAAMEQVERAENIKLDGVYTGKACAGMLYDLAQNPVGQDQVVLFWNTFCADDFADVVNTMHYKTALPSWAHTYFESDVQPLDRR